MNQTTKTIYVALALCCFPASVYSSTVYKSPVCQDGNLLRSCLVCGINLVEPEPFMASLRLSDSGDHYCGGTLIHPWVVLTAAHCVDNGEKPDIDIGRCRRQGDDSSGFDSYRTEYVILHEKFDPSSLDYDIALLVLDSASPRQLLPLASSDSCFQEQGGCKVRLVGWGRTSFGGKLARSIQHAFTTSISQTKCRKLLGASRITDRMICAGELENGGIDSCQGDSGGPMLLEGEQVGIVSFGYGCANAQSPGVYTSIPMLRSWIDAKLTFINAAAASSDPCRCAEDGISDGVSTSRLGCKQHLLQDGDKDFFCMTAGGLECSSAKPSEAFLGTGWVLCSPPVSSFDDPCACSEDGVSNGVATSLRGCKNHLAGFGDYTVFCMTVGGVNCPTAEPSNAFPGTGWILCNQI